MPPIHGLCTSCVSLVNSAFGGFLLDSGSILFLESIFKKQSLDSKRVLVFSEGQCQSWKKRRRHFRSQEVGRRPSVFGLFTVFLSWSVFLVNWFVLSQILVLIAKKKTDFIN